MFSKKIAGISVLIIILGFVSADKAETADCPLKAGMPYKTKDSATVYYIDESCTKRAIKNEAVYLSHFASWRDVRTIGAETLLKIPDTVFIFKIMVLILSFI